MSHATRAARGKESDRGIAMKELGLAAGENAKKCGSGGTIRGSLLTASCTPDITGSRGAYPHARGRKINLGGRGRKFHSQIKTSGVFHVIGGKLCKTDRIGFEKK